MGDHFSVQTAEFTKARSRRSRRHKVLAVLAAVVVFCTTYALILPAITKEQPVYCGYTDKHTDDCYEEIRTLTCTLPEGGHVHNDKCYQDVRTLSCTLTESEGHTHSDACYETVQTLSCTDPDHEHDESCYTESRVLRCGMEEAPAHHHSDACYTTSSVLTCGLAESTAHEHTDECYTIEKRTTCDHKVHEHTLQCYSDPEADVETRATWERTVERVELTDDWNADVLAIAKTQLGYHESERNYEVQANGVSMKGYTRYGAWYGIPYGDWCAMFCSFCLNYAEVDPKLMPRDANCPHWIETLSDEDFALYHLNDAEDYTPRPGDLIFFDWNDYKEEEDRESDHIGFVAELIYEEVPAEFGEEAHEELTKIKTIEGNSANQVRYVTYDIDDDRIMGYGEIPEKPAEENGILSSWLGGLRLMSLASGEYEPTLHFDYRTVDPTNGGENADKLFDGQTSTKYCVDLNSHRDDHIIIVCHADAPVYVTRYALTTGNDNVQEKRIQKNGWRLYGNNNSNNLTDLSSWTLIDTVADGQTGMDPAADFARYEFTIDSPGTYRYFALDITPTRTNGGYGENFFQFSEWDMIAPTAGEPAGGTTYYRKPVYSFDDLLGQYAVACLATNDRKVAGAMNGSLVRTANNQGIGRTQVQPQNGGGTIVGEDLVFWTITRAGAGKVNLHCANGYLVLTHNNGLQMTNDAEQATDFSVTLNSDGSFRLTTSEGCINSSGSDPAFINYWQAGDDLWLYTEENENPLSRTGTLERQKVYNVDQMLGNYAVACILTVENKSPGTIQAELVNENRLRRNPITIGTNGDTITGTDMTFWEIEKIDDSHIRLRNGDRYAVMPDPQQTANNFDLTTNPNSATAFEVVFQNDGSFMLKYTYGSTVVWINDPGGGGNFKRFEGERSDPLWLYRPVVNTDTSEYVWLDGTDGGLMNLTGSPNENHTSRVYTDEDGNRFLDLPATWQSPIKYNYTLAGWYDVYGKKYYLPGETAEISGSTVFYADWRAASYDVGQNNSHVIRDVDTSNFITTYVFDYSVLFNVMSTAVSGTVGSSSHSETWTLQQEGTNAYTGDPTLDFLFVDYDHDGQISYALNREERNINRAATITPGILQNVKTLSDKNLLQMLFDPASSFDPANHNGYIGVNYVGTGNFFYHYMEDGTDNYDGEHNGYYYYDSILNAASYNQSDSRFYVYDYLERTTDSLKDRSDEADPNRYSDILPFNSPYANNNGKEVVQYSHNGTNYSYDAKDVHSQNGAVCTTGHAVANYFYGIRSDVQFYLPNDSGFYDSDGNLGNQSNKGDDMFFEFSGDDDVWVYVDDQLILDIGGLHGVRTGNINFSTGEVNVYNEGDTPTTTYHSFSAGEHILHFYYMERGSSQANCSIYFNLAPRYTLHMLKEDIFTQLLLDGAEFTAFTDLACTQPALLWHNEAEYRAAFASGGESAAEAVASNRFTVTNGFTTCWGMAAGQTYYLKETKPPTDPRYKVAYDLICMKLNARGGAEYSAVSIDGNGDGDEDITIPGFDVDEETKVVNLSVTNRQQGTVEMSVQKYWNEAPGKTHDPITVYLRRNGERIGEPVKLSAENNWTYTWLGLPERDEEGHYYEYVYDVVEFPIAPGYESTGEWTVHSDDYPVWTPVGTPVPGSTYRLLSSAGILACSGNGDELKWISAEEAENNPNAEWVISGSGSDLRFQTRSGYKLAAYLGMSAEDSEAANFFASRNPNSDDRYTQTMFFSDNHIYASKHNQIYYLQGIYGDSAPEEFLIRKGGATLEYYDATYFNLYRKDSVSRESKFYKLTNTPIPDENETFIKVTKAWKNSGTHPAVTIRLFRGGEDTGRELTLSSANNWTGVFDGLPKCDDDGNEYVYTVQEDEVGGYRVDGAIPALTFVEDEPPQTPTQPTTPPQTQLTGSGTWSTVNASDASALNVGDVIRFGHNTNSGMYYVSGEYSDGHYVPRKANDSDTYQQWQVMSKTTSGSTVYYTLKNVGTGKFAGYNGSDWKLFETTDTNCKLHFRSVSGGQRLCFTANGQTVALVQNEGWVTYVDGEGQGTAFTFQKLASAQPEEPDEPEEPQVEPTGYGHYEVTVTNKPIETISLRTNKTWSDGNDAHAGDHVTVQLLADGEPTGKSVTLSAENGWQAEFTLLPKYQTDEKTPIVYTLSEDEFFGYAPTYGALQTVSQGVYSIGITNAPPAYVLPESGGGGTTIFYAFGGAMMLLAVMCGFSMRRKRERRSNI